MAAFLETMICRGAGLGLAGDATLAVPRPRARFESGIGNSTGFREAVVGPGAAKEAAGHAPPARDTHGPFTAAARPMDTSLLLPQPSLHEVALASYPQQRPWTSTGLQDPRDTAVPRGAEHRAPVQAPQCFPATRESARESAALPTQDVPRVAAGEAQWHAASVPAVLAERTPEAGRPLGPSVRDQGKTPAPMEGPARDGGVPAIGARAQEPVPEIGLSPEPYPRQEASPAVSVTIGRIEVEVAAPRPLAPARRTQPERTRGFAAYRNARRGRPR